MSEPATARLCANPACARPLTGHWRTCSRPCHRAAIQQRVFRCVVPGCVMPIGKNNVTCSVKHRREAEMLGLCEISQDNIIRRRSSSAPILPAHCKPTPSMPVSDVDAITRRTECASYRDCMHHAEHAGWHGFECGGCLGFRRADRTEDRERATARTVSVFDGFGESRT